MKMTRFGESNLITRRARCVAILQNLRGGRKLFPRAILSCRTNKQN